MAAVDQILVEIEPERFKLAVDVGPGDLRQGPGLQGRRRGGPQAARDRHHPEPRPDPGRRARDLADEGPPGRLGRGPDPGRPQPGQAQPARRLRPGAVQGDHPDPDRADGPVCPGGHRSWPRWSAATLSSSASASPSGPRPSSIPASWRTSGCGTTRRTMPPRSSTWPPPPTKGPGWWPSPPRSGTRATWPSGPAPSPRSRSRSARPGPRRSFPRPPSGPSERGFIAYVVENDTAVERILTIGMRTADGQAEVLSGVKPGEMLVVRGAEALAGRVVGRVQSGS